jgi:hypothetical protein
MASPRAGNGIVRERAYCSPGVVTGKTPCGRVRNDGTICQHPREYNTITHKETESCVGCSLAVREEQRRKWRSTSKRRAKKAVPKTEQFANLGIEEKPKNQSTAAMEGNNESH